MLNYHIGEEITLKRSKIGIRKKQKKTNIIIAVLFLFLLPVIAITIGSKITEWWVIPTINTDDMLKSPEEIVLKENGELEDDTIQEKNDTDSEVKGEELNQKNANLNSISIYMIQIASISDNKNIELLAEELDNHNLPHITYKLDDMYKIYTFASTRREDVESKIDEVKEIYEDAYIGQMHIPQKQIQYLDEENKGTKEFIEDMNLLLELLEQSSDNIYKSYSEESKLSKYKEILGNHKKLLEQMLEKVNNTELPKNFVAKDDIKNMIEHQEKNITESLKIIEGKQEMYKLQNYFLDNLFKTVEIIKK